MLSPNGKLPSGGSFDLTATIKRLNVAVCRFLVDIDLQGSMEKRTGINVLIGA